MKLESLETLLEVMEMVSFKLFDFEQDTDGTTSLDRHQRIQRALKDLQEEINEHVRGKYV
jgi:hypothetical protein